MQVERAAELVLGLLENVAKRLDFARGVAERSLVGMTPEEAARAKKFVFLIRRLEVAVADAIGTIEGDLWATKVSGV